MECVESDLVWMLGLQYCIMEAAWLLIIRGRALNTPDCMLTSEVKATVTARLATLTSQTDPEIATETS